MEFLRQKDFCGCSMIIFLPFMWSELAFGFCVLKNIYSQQSEAKSDFNLYASGVRDVTDTWNAWTMPK